MSSQIGIFRKSCCLQIHFLCVHLYLSLAMTLSTGIGFVYGFSSVVQIRISKKQMEFGAKESGITYAMISGVPLEERRTSEGDAGDLQL